MASAAGRIAVAAAVAIRSIDIDREPCS